MVKQCQYLFELMCPCPLASSRIPLQHLFHPNWMNWNFYNKRSSLLVPYRDEKKLFRISDNWAQTWFRSLDAGKCHAPIWIWWESFSTAVYPIPILWLLLNQSRHYIVTYWTIWMDIFTLKIIHLEKSWPVMYFHRIAHWVSSKWLDATGNFG